MEFTLHVKTDSKLKDIKHRCLKVLADFLSQEGGYDVWYDNTDVHKDIEVKEVDLEKEVEAYKDTFYRDEILYECAKHFFELGLKAQKGE